MARDPDTVDGHSQKLSLDRDYERHYRRLIHSLQEAFALAEIILDDNGNPVDYRFLEVNPAFETVTKISAESVVGKRMREVIPDVEEWWIETYGRVALTGEVAHFEAENKFLGKTFEVFAYSPEPGLFGHLFTDITEKRRAERAVADGKKIFEVAVNRFPGVFQIYDNERRVLYANEEALRLSSLTGAEIVGQRDEDIYRGDIWQQYLPALERVYESLDSETVEVQFGNGQTAASQMLHLVPVLDAGGAVQFVIGVAQDITKQKHDQLALRASENTAQQHLTEIEAIYRNAPVGLCVLDPELRFVRINARLAEIDGYSQEEHIGRTVHEIVSTIAAQVEPGLRSVLETGEPALNVEITGETPARPGVQRTWMASWFPVKDAEGRVTGLNIVADEISDLKKVESDLLEITKTLESRVEERTQSLENRTKQLRRLAVELLEAEERERKRVSDLLHEDLQQILAAVRLELHRALRTAKDSESLSNAEELLGQAIAKARHLSHELSPAVLQHSGLLESVEWLVRQVGEQFGLAARLEADNCDFDVSRSLKVFVFRAIQELLFNVAKHARVRSAEVRLECRDENLVFSVADKGRGFDPEELENGEGPEGIGLLGIRERTESIGGSLSIESMPGQGSRLVITVSLDFGKDSVLQNAAPAARSEENSRAEPTTVDTEKIRVMLAEDHRIIRQGLVSVISEQPDIEVVGEASNGREAVDIFRRTRPDVVLMDVSMPIMDGVEATRQIRADDPTVRIIGLSMYDDEQIQGAMKTAGAEAFVNKADSSGVLLRAIYGITDGVSKP